jgi:Protein of unknown function (DUF1552)
MPRFRLDRRALLKGTGGIALSLPLLEIMTPASAGAQNTATPPRRYVNMYAGVNSGPPEHIRPATVGKGFALPAAFAALEPVKDSFSVVTGLKLPQKGPGGWGSQGGDWHGSSLGPLVCGVSATGLSTPGVHGDAIAKGVTSDQVVADAIGGKTALKSLELRVQPDVYRENDNTYGVMSYRPGPNGKLLANQPYASPRLAWQALVTGFVPPNGQEDPALAAIRRQRLSVLDTVRGQSSRLMARLGKADATRMQRHFDELRELEARINMQQVPTVSSACKALGDPGADPPTKFVDYGNQFGPAGYSSENLRGPLMIDLVHMALVCDRTRVATVLLSFSQSFVATLPMFDIAGGGDFHGVLHEGNADKNAKVIGWHVKQLATLATKLQNTPEMGADGGTNVLQRTVLVLQFEGGWMNGDPHNGEGMAAIIGGGTVGSRKLNQGQHLVAQDKHPVSLNVSAMRYAMDADVTKLGEVTGGVAGL